jgi:hypothetical protein
MSPQRIQRKRTAGWKVPLCSCGCGKPAIYVGRPTPWGNPFVPRVIFCGPTIRELHTTTEVVAAYRDLLTRAVVHPSCWDRKFLDARQHADESIMQLTGHDLMCWCPAVDADGNRGPCHADVLLELANGGTA